MDPNRPIRVLVVDDSALMRKTIGTILAEAEGIEVVATARDGHDAIRKTTDLRPDVITLDIEMPRLDGLETLGYIMSEVPTPVVMLSAYTAKGGETTMRALEYGAVDFVCKPSGPISLDLKRIGEELVAKIRLAASVDVARLSFIDVESLAPKRTVAPTAAKGRQIVLIASSTGGPRALYEVIPKLPADFPAAVLVVQHMSTGFTRSLAQRFQSASPLRVREAADGEPVLAGDVLFAPGNHHMILERRGDQEVVRLHQGPTRNSVRPSADVTFESAAALYGSNALAVIMTGMGRDGADGARAVKRAGGGVIAQNEATCVIYGMPKAVVDAGFADAVLPLDDLAEAVVRAVRHRMSSHAS